MINQIFINIHILIALIVLIELMAQGVLVMAKINKIINNFTTITISRDNKNKIDDLKHVHKQRNVNDLISLMIGKIEIEKINKHEVKKWLKKKNNLKK